MGRKVLAREQKIFWRKVLARRGDRGCREKGPRLGQTQEGKVLATGIAELPREGAAPGPNTRRKSTRDGGHRATLSACEKAWRKKRKSTCDGGHRATLSACEKSRKSTRDGDRTRDPRFRKPTLYPLSYASQKAYRRNVEKRYLNLWLLACNATQSDDTVKNVAHQGMRTIVPDLTTSCSSSPGITAMENSLVSSTGSS